MVIAGSTRCATVPEPETGSNPSLIAKNRIRMGPRAKLGKDDGDGEPNSGKRVQHAKREIAQHLISQKGNLTTESTEDHRGSAPKRCEDRKKSCRREV